MSAAGECGYPLPCGCASCPRRGPDPEPSRVAGAIGRGLDDARRARPDLGPWDD